MQALRNRVMHWPSHPGQRPVLNRWGAVIRWEYSQNTLGAHIYPGEKVVKIDWKAAHSDPTFSPKKPLNKWPGDATWKGGVEFDGDTYYPYYVPSSLKTGITLGVQRDFVTPGTIRYVEDLAYMGRAYDSTAIFGGVCTDMADPDDVIWVYVVPGKDNVLPDSTKGWCTKSGHYVYDGGGLIARRLWLLGKTDHDLIHLRTWLPVTW